MKKLISLFVVVLGFLMLSSKAEATAAARGAKGYSTVAYTTTVSSVSLPTTAVSQPAVLYTIILSTGATGDFVAVFDTNTVLGITSAVQTTGVLVARCVAGSTLAVTRCDYDPPIQFGKGIAAVLSTASDHAVLIWEKGRVTQGY